MYSSFHIDFDMPISEVVKVLRITKFKMRQPAAPSIEHDMYFEDLHQIEKFKLFADTGTFVRTYTRCSLESNGNKTRLKGKVSLPILVRVLIYGVLSLSTIIAVIGNWNDNPIGTFAFMLIPFFFITMMSLGLTYRTAKYVKLGIVESFEKVN